jgi:hypothetical protein
MTTFKEIFLALVPLFQSVVWVALIAWLFYYFRQDIQLLRRELQKRIESGEQLEFGPVKLQKIEQKVAIVEKDVNITKQFLLSMSKPMYDNLVKIASGNFGTFKIDKGSGLQRELYHLRDIGYVQVHSIRHIPDEGTNLSDYVKITPIGKKFVELRESFVSEAENRPNL